MKWVGLEMQKCIAVHQRVNDTSGWVSCIAGCTVGWGSSRGAVLDTGELLTLSSIRS